MSASLLFFEGVLDNTNMKNALIDKRNADAFTTHWRQQSVLTSTKRCFRIVNLCARLNSRPSDGRETRVLFIYWFKSFKNRSTNTPDPLDSLPPTSSIFGFLWVVCYRVLQYISRRIPIWLTRRANVVLIEKYTQFRELCGPREANRACLCFVLLFCKSSRLAHSLERCRVDTMLLLTRREPGTSSTVLTRGP